MNGDADNAEYFDYDGEHDAAYEQTALFDDKKYRSLPRAKPKTTYTATGYKSTVPLGAADFRSIVRAELSEFFQQIMDRLDELESRID